MPEIQVGITGADGFIGWHLQCFLHGKPGVEVIPADSTVFDTPELLASFVRRCDAIVHLAGMNRGDERELYETNVSLVESLVAALEATGVTPHVIFASSTHIDRDTPYGLSKKRGTELFQEWSARCDARFSNMVLPHVFGEHQLPFYNSVVATFCYQLAQNESPAIIDDSVLELIHVQEVAEAIYHLVKAQRAGDIGFSGTSIKVSELLGKLQDLAQSYQGQIIPELKTALDLALLNTYRSYLFPQGYPVKLTLHQDNRGRLFEAVKSLNGGQCFISTTKPGVTRGNHYHLSKFERFLVVEGDAVIRIRRMLYGDIDEFSVSGLAPQFVDIPTLHTHSITNIGQKDLITLFWSHEILRPDQPDTYPERV